MRWLLVLAVLVCGCHERYACDRLLESCIRSCKGSGVSVDVTCFSKCAEAYDTCMGEEE